MSFYVAQAGFELCSSCLSLFSAGIIDVNHHTWLDYFRFMKKKALALGKVQFLKRGVRKRTAKPVGGCWTFMLLNLEPYPRMSPTQHQLNPLHTAKQKKRIRGLQRT
jgi:hypothetical protein